MMLSNHTFSQFNSQAETFLHNIKNTTITTSLQVPTLMKVTFDCGVQTNLEDRESLNEHYQQNPQNTEDVIMKKKQKRKQYKKRKKIQQKLMQRQNRQQFKRIIDLFYQRDAKFLDFADKLQQLVCSFNQNDFKNMFDSILKQRVVIIQNSIWQYTQAILDTNPALMRHDHPFFNQMVDQIYKYYRLIQRSSKQAQQVIYIYLSLNSKDPDQQITSQNLDIRTFRYLVETDDDIKVKFIIIQFTMIQKLIKTCDQKISLIRIQQRLKLQVIISKLKNFRQKYYSQHFDQQDQDQNQQYYDQDQQQDDQQQSQHNREENQNNYDEKSTTISENVQQFEQQHHNIKKIKKNKKDKTKNKKQNYVETEEDKIGKFLEMLTINQESRLECRLDTEDVQIKTKKYLGSLKKKSEKGQFQYLMKSLLKLKPNKLVSKQFKRIFFQK